MLEAAAILDRLDRIATELLELRAELAEQAPAATPNGASVEGDDDFAQHNMASVQAASERWNVPQDTLRCWLRSEQGLAIKSGNVWRVSVPALRRRLARRGE
jgi:hypothetical protein